jgi:soluble lytic murein transglycosylase-like protein
MILRLIVRRAADSVAAGWLRLSATQRLTMRGLGVLAIVLAIGAVAGANAPRADAASDDGAYTGTAIQSQFRQLRVSLDTTAGELELARLKLDRAEAILHYSAHYQVPADLVELIYDAALREGIDPELAFRLVNLESDFKVRAHSHANALGLAQVQPATARFYEPTITPEQLFDPTTNLRIGFRYLRHLIETYGDVKLALLAYNRGPGRVKELLDAGRDPRNGYASRIMEGYRGVE